MQKLHVSCFIENRVKSSEKNTMWQIWVIKHTEKMTYSCVFFLEHAPLLPNLLKGLTLNYSLKLKIKF